MSDHRDKDDHNKDFSVDDILAEYGSKSPKKPRKVVDFLEETGRMAAIRVPEDGLSEKEYGKDKAKEKGKVRPPAGDLDASADEADGEETQEEKVIIEIGPKDTFHRTVAWFSTFRRRADHFADHMYDQAEPDEDDPEEDYLPKVDEEEPLQEEPLKKDPLEKPRQFLKRVRPERPKPPDTAPSTLAARYAKGLKSKKVRTSLAMLCAILCAVFSLFDLDTLRLAALLPETIPLDLFRQGLVLGLLVLTGVFCVEVVLGGLILLATLRPGPETTIALAFWFTVADSVVQLIAPTREGLPCSAVVALGLAFTLWGGCARRQGDRVAARAAAQVREPFVVTLDEGKWSGHPAYVKWSGTQAGFGSALQSEDGVQRAYLIAVPLLILACLVCSVLSAVSGRQWQRFFWAASSTLTAVSAWSAPLVYNLPWRKLARRLFGEGAALAGWTGASRCHGTDILISDSDLFPTGSVQVTGIRVFGDFANEQVVAYTATLMRILDCDLTRPFHDLLRKVGTFYREASNVRFHEGGVTGGIRRHEVFVGTSDFMRYMDVKLPQGLVVKHAIFCAIDGELAGIFTLHYDLGPTVKPSLSALIRAGASPILTTRDPNLIPGFLEDKFKLPVDKMEFPPVNRRLDLSDPEQDHDDTPVALLNREGLTSYCDAVVGARRLRFAVRLGTLFALTGSCVGLALTFYLTFMGAAASLSPANFLVYMAMWLVPVVLLNYWVDRY